MIFVKGKPFTISVVLIIGVIILPNLLVSVDTEVDTKIDLSFKSSKRKMNEYPLDYTIVDHYANGERKVRGTRNSLGPSLPRVKVTDPKYAHPLTKYQTTMLGGKETLVCYDDWVEVLRADYFIDSKNVSQKHWYNDLFDDSTYLGGTSGTQEGTYDLASGDLDGNFLNDIVTVSRANNNTVFTVEELWAGKAFAPMASSRNLHFGDCGTIPTVETGDLDGDALDEFLVLGIRNSKPQIWIFDDLMDSENSHIVNYGDKILFQSYEGYSYEDFLFSEIGSTEIHPELINRSSPPAEVEFTVLRATNLSYDGPMEFGHEVVLIDSEGHYWKVDSANEVKVDLLADESQIGQENVFKLISDRGKNASANGFVYSNHFVGFEAYQGGFVSTFSNLRLELEETNEWANRWFKVISPSKLPKTFKTEISPIITLNHTNFANIDTLGRIDSSQYDYHISTKSLTTGDVDGDGIAEIIVAGLDSAGRVKAWIFDDLLNDCEIIIEISWASDIRNVTPEVISGDVDKDSIAEIVIALTNASFGQIEVLQDKNDTVPFSRTRISSIDDKIYGDITRIATGDTDGDGRDEIVFVNGSAWIYVWDDRYSNYAFNGSWNSQARLIPNYRFANGDPLPSVDFYKPVSLTCGDIDIDGSEEILLSTYETKLNLADGAYGGFLPWDYNGTIGSFMFIGEGLHAYNYIPKVLVEDFNADEFTLRYMDHDIYTSDEQLLAVMAAPPTQAGISQNYDGSSTEFGEGKASTAEGFSGIHGGAGGYFSYEQEVSFWGIKAAKFETESEFMVNFDLTNTIIYTSSYMDTYIGDYESDYVIFSANLYDLFTYEVINAPDPSLKGTNMSLHIPNGMDIFKWDREYYNSHNSEPAFDIGPEILNHTIGYLPSYPTKEEMQKIAPNRLQTSGMQIGKGKGANKQEVDLTTETQTDFDLSYDINFKIGAGGGGAVFGIMINMGEQSGFSVNLGEETAFSGTIGDISSDDDYANFHYRFTLCVYSTYVPPNFLAQAASGLTQHYTETVREIQVSIAKLISGTDTLYRGEGFYILNYFVELPLYWGEDAQQVAEYASDVEAVFENLDVPGFTFFSVFLILLPLLIRGRKTNIRTRLRKES